IELKNKIILEIGSGWMPLLAYFLKIKGSINKVYTYDINKHYQQNNLDNCYANMASNYTTNIKLTKKGEFTLPDFIEYHPFTNIINAKLPKDIDIVISRFVLEHVTPKDLVAIHKKLYESLPNDAAVLHLISPSDHRAHNDSSLSLYDFLKYSKREWDKIQTKFDYHNRLRLPNYLEIFKSAGFEVSYVEYDKAKENEEKYKKFKALEIHSDFKHYTEDELTAGSINVLLRKKA
ncbi:MAG: class I SAM-dependent methyltransferase, partial [Bacteroidia bacterium]|nr:class I SAM-dependent methyltransferase [Bacteroidia bacterium]